MTNFTVVCLLVLALVACAYTQIITINGVNLLPGSGKCPRVVPGSTAVCANLCNSDSDCAPILQKCCSNGCGRECRNVYAGLTGIIPEVHPGFCPAMRFDQAGICLLPCKHDGECPSNFKCCIASGCPTFTCQLASSTAVTPFPSIIQPTWPFGR